MHRERNNRSTPIALPARIGGTATLLLTASLAWASVVEIAWDDNGGFQHEAELGAGAFAEVCGALSREEQVQWTFEASAALDFNIHYHEGDEVVYPEELAGSARGAGVLVAPVDQTYCWMWTSGQSSPATVTLQLSH